MTKLQDFRRLQTLSQLMLDHRLSELKRAADAKRHSELAIANLSQVLPEITGLTGAAAGIAALNYQRWADQRRAALNQTLALQTHDWLEARDAARTALGKSEALSKIADKM